MMVIQYQVMVNWPSLQGTGKVVGGRGGGGGGGGWSDLYNSL